VQGKVRPFGGLLAAHRLRLGDHELVERTASRLRQRGDAGDLRGEVVGHVRSLPVVLDSKR
jgi:hypothetical protein